MWLDRIKNKYGDFARDLVPVDDEETLNLFKRRELQNSVSRGDVVDGKLSILQESVTNNCSLPDDEDENEDYYSDEDEDD